MLCGQSASIFHRTLASAAYMKKVGRRLSAIVVRKTWSAAVALFFTLHNLYYYSVYALVFQTIEWYDLAGHWFQNEKPLFRANVRAAVPVSDGDSSAGRSDDQVTGADRVAFPFNSSIIQF